MPSLTHRKRLLPLFLAAALLLAGCGSEPDSGDPDIQQIKTNLGPLATYLDLDTLSETTLSSCYQTVDQEEKAGGAVLRVTETAGDGMILHVAFSFLPPKDSDAFLSPKDVSLVQGSSADDGYIGASPTNLQSTENDDGGYDCLATFLYDREVLRAGEPLTLAVRGSGEDSSSCSVTWTQEKLGTVSYVDLKDGQGTMVGTALLSPFALNISLWDTRGVSPQDLQDSISLLDSSGEALPVQGAFVTESGTFFSGQFFAPVELERVHSIHIGLFTTPLHQDPAEQSDTP